MKAVMLTRYGSPNVLSVQETAKPTPKAGEVLVKIHASGVNDWDCSLVRGKPYLYRLLYGIFKPKIRIPGIEVAGVVEDAGPGARHFKPGDRVYGDLSDGVFGGFADSVCVPEKHLTLMPAGLSFTHAAAIPHAAALALQGLVDVGGIKPGERVLVNGAGGGAGVIALQIAKHYGCTVTGVDRGFKGQALKDLGYDSVLDFEQTDFTAMPERYDLILDTKTTRLPHRYLKALAPGGRYITVGGNISQLLLVFLTGLILKATGLTQKRLLVLALKPNKGLDVINQMIEAQKLEVLIDGTYRLDEIGPALQRFGAGLHTGKIVLKIT